LFVYEGEFISNVKNNLVFDVDGNKDEEARNVHMHKRHNGSNQRWKVVYLDKAEAILTKGLDEDFGFHRNRPFYIRSRLPFQRIVQCHGAVHVRINRWKKNNKTQQFYFDAKTKTIRSN